MTIDRNDAPEGYEAREPNSNQSCEGCAFANDGVDECNALDRQCVGTGRADEKYVIFVKRKPRLVATGGRRPTPPEWAKRFRQHFRDGDAGSVHEGHSLPPGGSHWKQTGGGADILFVEWLP